MNQLFTIFETLIRFIKKPYYFLNLPNLTLKEKMRFILSLLCIKIIFLTTIFFIVYVLEQLNFANMDTFKDDEDSSLIIVFFSIVIISPILEELMFRVSLTYTLHLIEVSLSMLLGFAILYAVDAFYQKNNVGFIFFVIIGISAFIMLMISLFQKPWIRELYRTRFKYLLYCYVCIFAFSHLFGNVNDLSLTILMPLVFLNTSHIFSGFVYSFIRINFGFWWGVLTHSIYNAAIFSISEIMKGLNIF